VGLGVLGLLCVVAMLEILPRSGAVDPRYLPPATSMASSLGRLVQDGDFWIAVGQTLRGWAIGLSPAMLIGVAAGLVIGSVPLLRATTASTIEFLRPIPSVALIPLVVLLLRQPAAVRAHPGRVRRHVAGPGPGALRGADVDPVARDTARSYRFSALVRRPHGDLADSPPLRRHGFPPRRCGCAHPGDHRGTGDRLFPASAVPSASPSPPAPLPRRTRW
jgi:hypothetical protein